MDRRTFTRTTGAALAGLTLAPSTYGHTMARDKAPLKLSLAQWSLHRAFNAGDLDPDNFAQITKQAFGIEAVEYVNQFYVAQAKKTSFWQALRRRADDHGVRSLLIMVDNEGDLGDPNQRQRKKAAQNHHKWVDAAKVLGCHSIRVNAFGEGNQAELRAALVDGLGQLVTYSAQEEVHVLIENHGLFSSDADFVVDVIKEVDSPYLGTLPDFGNWCLTAQWGSTKIPCDRAFDRYEGVQAFLPYAQGVSAKSYDFKADGSATVIDYARMLNIVADFGYDGYIGIEYEGDVLSESEGIIATKKLIEKVWAAI